MEHQSVLSEFGYSAEQAASTVRQLGRFAGAGGLQHCTADDIELRHAADIRPRIPEEAPFMIDALSFQNLGGKGSASVYDGVCRQSGCRTLDASIFPSSAH